MKNRIVFSMLMAAVALIPASSRAEEGFQLNLLRTYFFADGKVVAVAMPAEWDEVSKTRHVPAQSSISFLDESGRPVVVPADALMRASVSKSVIWAGEYSKVRLTAQNQ